MILFWFIWVYSEGTPPSTHPNFKGVKAWKEENIHTECRIIYRKSVLHLLKYTANLYLSGCRTDLRYIFFITLYASYISHRKILWILWWINNFLVPGRSCCNWKQGTRTEEGPGLRPPGKRAPPNLFWISAVSKPVMYGNDTVAKNIIRGLAVKQICAIVLAIIFTSCSLFCHWTAFDCTHHSDSRIIPSLYCLIHL